MQIHNLMEDRVIEEVHNFFDDIDTDASTSGICTCYQCRLDVVCFVLNRISPQYVISGRGLAHTSQDYQLHFQRKADVASLINEGIKTVSKTKRPHFLHSRDEELPFPSGPVFNFPTIIGKLLNGKNFEPLSNIEIGLYLDNKLSRMINPSWENPCRIDSKTIGTFLFWNYPLKAKHENEISTFHFELRVKETGYEELHHYFELELTSDSKFRDTFYGQKTFKLKNLHLFPA